MNKLLSNKYKAFYKRGYYSKSFLDGIVILFYRERNTSDLKDFC
jgi:hypothetical protein